MAEVDKKVLSYGDVVLWSSDVQLLRDECFLNDRLIEFFFAQLAVPQDYLLLPPAIAFWISHCPDTLTLLSTVEPLRLLERQVVMFAINNNEDVTMVGGGYHWSLLVYIRELNKFEHYDSMSGMNVRHAKKLASTIKSFLGPEAASAEFEEAWTPHQENAYDCGVYVMAVAQVLCQAYANGPVGSSECRELMREKVTPSAVSEMRGSVLNRILSLAEEQHKS
eukprot:c12377_g1_i2 orf=134-799(-)